MMENKTSMKINKDDYLDENEFEIVKIVKRSKGSFPGFQPFNNKSSLKRTTSAPDLSAARNIGRETKSVEEVTEKLLLTSNKLRERTEECQWLRDQNLQLSSLLESLRNEKSLFKRVFTSSNKNKKNLSAADVNEQTQELHQKILELETELEDYKELKERLYEIIREKLQLKLDYEHKIEIQKELLEDLEEKVKNREEKLIVERKLREQRETEISQLQSYLHKKEKYYEKQLQQRDTKIKAMEISHEQDINTLNLINKQKEEEISQIKLHCTKNGAVGTDSLLESLELKTKQLQESNDLLQRVQRVLNNKCKELEKVTLRLENCRTKTDIVEKLQNAKKEIVETLNDLYQVEKYELSDSYDQILENVGKKIGDKEEADSLN